MSELAFNINGEGFEVPAHATGWRVRRMRTKGSPEVVYGRDGLPLMLPIDAELDDLRAEVTIAGRYRLDLVDQNNKAIADGPSGYVQVNPEAAPVNGASTAFGSTQPSKPSDNIVIEAMRTQSAMALAVIERFPQMMESAATLLRAADGAGLPAREPRVLLEEDEDDDGEDGDEPSTSRPGFDLNKLVAQIVPILMASLGSGKLKIPGLGELLDWRKATPDAPHRAKANRPAKLAEASGGTDARDPDSDNAHDVLPPLAPQTMAHFIAVQSALTPEEGAIAREVAKDLTAAELRAWFDELGKLTVTEAVERVLGYAFDTLRAHRVRVAAATGNARSLSVIRRAGFRFEGVAREAEFCRGRWLDHAVFSLLKRDRVEPRTNETIRSGEPVT